MLISRVTEPEFKPIIITIQSQNELEQLQHLAGCWASPEKCVSKDIAIFADFLHKQIVRL
jgi:hypothetical protein